MRIESLTEGVEQDETVSLPATGSVPVVLHEARYRFTASHEAANTVFDGTRFSLAPDADGLLPEPGRAERGQAGARGRGTGRQHADAAPATADA